MKRTKAELEQQLAHHRIAMEAASRYCSIHKAKEILRKELLRCDLREVVK